MIRYSEQSIDKDDIQGISKVLKSSHLTQGELLEKFENKISKSVSSKYTACVSNATAALHLAYKAAGMSENSLVWTVGNTFVATASAAVYCGASVDFVDINICNFSFSKEDFIRRLDETTRKPDFIVVVHFAGRPLDLKEIAKICVANNIIIIEDASHALGADIEGSKVGSCRFSLATVFSFHPVKIITTAEGGSVSTNNEDIFRRVKALRSHSIENQGGIPWYKNQTDIGYNYRLNEIQASLGLTQIKKLPKFQSIRTKQAENYFSELQSSNFILPEPDNTKIKSAWHLFVVRLPTASETKRNFIIRKLHERNIGANLHYFPLYKLNTFKKKSKNFPNNELYFKTAITLPLNLKMNETEQLYIIDTIKKLNQKL